MIMIYFMILPTLQVIYYTQHFKFQILIFVDYVRNQLVDFERELLNEGQFQNEVEERLKIAIKHSIQLYTGGRNKIREIKYLILLFAFSGSFSIIAVIFSTVVGVTYTSQEYFLRLSLLFVTFLAAALGFIISGQSIETQNEITGLALGDVIWYEFNQKSQKLYLMFLVKLMTPVRVEFSERYSINFELGLTILRMIYSAMSVIASFKQ